MPSKLKVDTRVTVETPEGVDFQFQVAGPGKRALSFVVDLLLKFGTIAVAFILVAVAAGLSTDVSKVAFGFALFVWFCMSWLYGSCFEAFSNGQTPGKRSQNLRVVRTNGTSIGWFEAFGRNLLLVADGMLVLGPLALNTVGLVAMSSNKRMQRLGDLFFDTMVIDESREFISRAPGITHGVEKISRLHCVGRFNVPERTLAVVERLFEGDRVISDSRREEIARGLSITLQQRLGFEEPGPDPANPNSYFVRSPVRHTLFLKRILKTFSDEPDADAQPVSGPKRNKPKLNAVFSADEEQAYTNLEVTGSPKAAIPDAIEPDAEVLVDANIPVPPPSTAGRPTDGRSA